MTPEPAASPRVVDGRLVLSDPRAMRVLAHEARLALINELEVDGAELTASELAGRVGLSPSALSYHLRVLERFGIVRRAASREDGRERPWVRTADHIVVESAGSDASAAAQSTVIGQVIQTVQAHWDDWIRAEPHQTEEWRDAATLARNRLWLTAHEAGELVAALQVALEPYRGRREAGERPPGTLEIELVTMLVPRAEP